MVLITFRTLQKKVYKIELEPSATIADAKAAIVKEMGTGDPATIRLILNAKLPDNSQTIESLNLTEKSFFVVQIPKAPAAPAPVAPAPTADQTPAPTKPTSAPVIKPLDASSTEGRADAVKKSSLPSIEPLPSAPAAPATQTIPMNPAGGLQPPAGGEAGQIPEMRIEDSPEFQAALTQLIELGYPRTDCIAALKAAYGNPDRAAEFLINGHIPEDVEQDMGQGYPSQDQIRQTIQSLVIVLQSKPEALENVIQLLERGNPGFRQQPEILLQSFGLDPSHFDCDAVRNHTAQPIPEQEFATLQAQAMVSMGVPLPGLGIPGTGGAAPAASLGANGGAQPAQPAPQPAQGGPSPEDTLLAPFSPEEKESIRRLQQLGNFPLVEVVQCYVACDKSEEMTANLLFSMH